LWEALSSATASRRLDDAFPAFDLSLFLAGQVLDSLFADLQLADFDSAVPYLWLDSLI
jgi:hypothetical protein